jgi:ketosteroid isomerase-like protein
MADRHPNAAVIERLYAALDAADGEAMASLYAGDAVFSDPAFGELHGDEPGDMWRMLCSQAKDLDASVSDVEADDSSGSANWVAHYTFSATGRPVENRIHAEYRFRDGEIVEHRDSFSMLRWAPQALGPVGYLLGSNPIGRSIMQRRARGQLAAYREKRGDGRSAG